MRLLGILLVGLAFLHSATAAHTTARLWLSHEAARPGETVWAGLNLRMDSGWHTYWRNPGESGAPTTVSWKLPPGVAAGAVQWPAPETSAAGGLTTYVHHDEVTLLVPLTLAATAAPGAMDIAADLRWLECEKLCVPGRGSVSGRLVIGAESKASSAAPAIERARRLLPTVQPDGFARAWWEGPAAGDKRAMVLDWPGSATEPKPDFFPFAAEAFAVGPSTEALPSTVGRVRLRATVEKLSGDWPKSVEGLVVERTAAGAVTKALEVLLAVAATAQEGMGLAAGEGVGAGVGAAAAASSAAPGDAPLGSGAGPTAAESATSGATTAAEPAASSSTRAAGGQLSFALLLTNLGLAFIGGLILNLMPCVLPVIALKILGFVNQSQGSPAEARRLGLVYGAGVLASLLVLAGFIIAVKSAGKSASWGMQFQNPMFVVAITTLVTLVALNLFGVFEVNLAAGAMGKAGDLAGREGAAGAFFNGVLAVVLATPCSAPFLGIALGFAFAQPSHVIVLTFSAVAVGLAFPYVLLSFFPQFLKFLPKPGVWMERFKNGMGFPMLATAIWLLTLTGAHYGNDGVLWVGLFLVMVSIAAWIWGQFVQRGGKRTSLAAVIALLFAVGGYAVALESQLHWRSPVVRASASGPHTSGGIGWQPWSAAAVGQARQEGRPVFVDFTADWCITCQANKKTSIEIDSVRKRLRDINAVTLLGDFTAEDESIAAELQKFGRAAVPLVLVYPKNPASPPIILPEVLTPGMVLEALDKAAR